MGLDALGEWLDLGSVDPSFDDWISYGIIQPSPSQVIRVSFANFDPLKASSFVRIRGIYFTALRTDVTFSIKVFPSEQARVIELPVSEEILGQKEWHLAVEVKKYKGYRRFLGQMNDQINYSVSVQSWTAKEGFYLQPSEVAATDALVPRGSGRFTNNTLSSQVPNGLDDYIG
jgi:hypothetical protein